MKKGGRMKRWGMSWLAVALLAVAVSGCQSAGEKMALSGKSLYDEKCRTVAGEKIYKKVPEVEGILLMKVPTNGHDREWRDPMWPGAALAHERSGTLESYIHHFLWYESPALREGKMVAAKLSLTTDVTDYPGYRYVDVIDAADGKRYRYSGRWEEPWQYDKSYLKGYIKFFLDKKPAPDPAPRYGVVFEDHVVPDERAVWVASSTVNVVDLQTKEVLGEMTRYAWAAPPNPANPSPWLTSYRCGGHSDHQVTRFFVDQVLVPAKAKQQ